MKETIKRFLSLIGIKSRKYVEYCFDRDATIFMTNSGLQGDTLPVVTAKMRILCHTIEKALSLTDCRADFGKEKIKELVRLYLLYITRGGNENNVLDLVHSTLSVYIHHRSLHGLDCSFIPQELRDNTYHDTRCGAMYFPSTQNDFKTFSHIAHARHSVRNYSGMHVKQEDIIKAVELAQTAPSACNRQASRIYAITDEEKIRELKQRHGGIRTFGQPGVIFAITQDINMYINEYERNTWLVDGGIFCMNLLYALNSVGIVNCPVIWGGMDDEDRFLSDIAGIPDNERTVILVVGGYVPEENVKTPCSPKRPLNDILHIIK